MNHDDLYELRFQSIWDDYLSIYLPTYLPIYLSIYLSIYSMCMYK